MRGTSTCFSTTSRAWCSVWHPTETVAKQKCKLSCEPLNPNHLLRFKPLTRDYGLEPGCNLTMCIPRRYRREFQNHSITWVVGVQGLGFRHHTADCTKCRENYATRSQKEPTQVDRCDNTKCMRAARLHFNRNPYVELCIRRLLTPLALVGLLTFYPARNVAWDPLYGLWHSLKELSYLP